ncbi:hypothetical protein DITRI_Ditri05aG0086500 [Diplodiscus trichospermus]
MDHFHSLPVVALLLNVNKYLEHLMKLCSLPAENYWKSVFPDNPMPKALQNLLKPDGNMKALTDMVHYNTKVTDVLGVYIHYQHNVENLGFGNKDAAADGNMLQSQYHFQESSEKFPDVFKYFSLEAKSAEANLMKETIQNCEIPAIEGEKRYCATSLESLVDWSVSELGNKIPVFSNKAEKETQKQEFTIAKGVKKIGEKEIVCHKMKYAYAVFLRHSIEKSSAYSVPLVCADGTKSKLLAICHKYTPDWGPDHLAFQILKDKPGTIPVCHFLTRETLVWVPI